MEQIIENEMIKYLQNKQVLFRKEIISSDFKTVAIANAIHNVGAVTVTIISDSKTCLYFQINNEEIIIYRDGNIYDLQEWVTVTFIPLSVLVDAWLQTIVKF